MEISYYDPGQQTLNHSYVLQQSAMTISDIDWKDSYDVIDEDERKMNIDSESRQLSLSEPQVKREKARDLCWWSPNGHGKTRSDLGRLPSDGYDDHDDDVEATSITSQPEESQLHAQDSHVLSVEQLADIMSSHSLEMGKSGGSCSSSLFSARLFASCDDLTREVGNVDSGEHEYELSLSEAELQQAIDAAIVRRQSFGPENKNFDLHVAPQPQQQQQQQRNSTHAMNVSMVNETEGLALHHKFVQFFVDIQRFEADIVEKECSALLRHYVSALNEGTDDSHGNVEFFQSQFNHDSKQCTFYLLVSSSGDGDDENQAWCQLFLRVASSRTWLSSIHGQIAFSAFAPQTASKLL